ncbi:histidine phosphatase family protein [Ruminococcaceae bacterium OttesenSCG-928-D13]|nr:histidine phosphatase family protein [Ruminococcaceae bacterium OttesenSCG-928-D13]
MKIYLTRHGQTDWNIARKVSGVTNIQLTDTGRAQARALGEKIRDEGIPIGRIITSDLDRAAETGDIVGGIIGVPVQRDPRLRERDFGTVEGTSYDDAIFKDNNYEMARKIGGGESVLKMAQRIYNFLDELPEKYPDETILLVGHGAMGRVVHTYFNSLSNEEYSRVRLGNCELRAYDL